MFYKITINLSQPPLDFDDNTGLISTNDVIPNRGRNLESKFIPERQRFLGTPLCCSLHCFTSCVKHMDEVNVDIAGANYLFIQFCPVGQKETGLIG